MYARGCACTNDRLDASESYCSENRIEMLQNADHCRFDGFSNKVGRLSVKKLYIRSGSCVTFDDDTNNTIEKKISDEKSNEKREKSRE